MAPLPDPPRETRPVIAVAVAIAAAAAAAAMATAMAVVAVARPGRPKRYRAPSGVDPARSRGADGFRATLYALRLVLCLALCGALLGACTPTYNWREVSIADGAVRATFPARAQTDTRDLQLGRQPLRFSLTSARVGDAVFAVGYAPLPPGLADNPTGQGELAAALVRSLHENLNATPPGAVPAYGADIEVRGQAGRQPVWALARVWVHKGLLIEAVATGSEKGLPPEPAWEFVHSLRFGAG